MALNFPSNPTTNQVFSSGSKSWKYSGSRWVPVGPPRPQYIVAEAFPSGTALDQSIWVVTSDRFPSGNTTTNWGGGAIAPANTVSANTMTLVPGFDGDYLNITFYFKSGSDLDMRLSPQNLSVTPTLGWGQSNTYSTWGDWAGDDKGGDPSSAESVYFNIPAYRAENPDLPELTIDLRAFWYSAAVSDPVVVNVALFKGGAMTPTGTTWSNFSYKFKFSNSSYSKVVSTSNTSPSTVGDRLCVLRLNFLTGYITLSDF